MHAVQLLGDRGKYSQTLLINPLKLRRWRDYYLIHVCKFLILKSLGFFWNVFLDKVNPRMMFIGFNNYFYSGFIIIRTLQFNGCFSCCILYPCFICYNTNNIYYIIFIKKFVTILYQYEGLYLRCGEGHGFGIAHFLWASSFALALLQFDLSLLEVFIILSPKKQIFQKIWSRCSMMSRSYFVSL